MLAVEGLQAGYDDITVVRDVSFSVVAGQVFVLLGANGAGKTTTLRSISGLIRPRAGRILADGRDITGLRPSRIARLGIAHVPEGRRVFAGLSVDQNLTAGFIKSRARDGFARLKDEVYSLFPRLRERAGQAAGTLSGGEQQMLAIGRALMGSPALIMLDEPSLGLSPVMTELVFERLAAISRTGAAILLVEQNASAIDLATSGAVIRDGRTVLAGSRQDLVDSDYLKTGYLGH